MKNNKVERVGTMTTYVDGLIMLVPIYTVGSAVFSQNIRLDVEYVGGKLIFGETYRKHDSVPAVEWHV